MRLPSILLRLCAVGLPLALAVDPFVDLGYSKYQGSAQSNGVSSWLGVRFAAPPLGDLRWRAPQDPPYNSTVQIANKHGLLCLASAGSPTDNTTSEDCLFLDVYAPSNASSSSKLPVYFWIQGLSGGGYNSDANANYRGDGLIIASGMNIVVVNFNYRVSLYGFLASKEVVQNGDTNVGLLDQRQAMKWVQQHISTFGGDPNHVTVGGASAGGGSIALHLTAYGGRDDGLFHATASESQAFPVMLTILQSQYQYDALVKRVGCSNTTDTLACLRQTNATRLQTNNTAFPYPSLGANASAPRYLYGPVIDGGIITDYTDRLFSRGSFIKVPVIFGDDTNEGTHFAPTNTSTLAQMDQYLIDQYPGLTSSELNHINSLYPIAEQFNGTGMYFRALSNAYGEMALICPGIAISNAFLAYSKKGNWNYRFNVLDPAQEALGLGVSHTVEIGSIWGPQNLPGSSLASYNTTNAAIIPVMQGYWTSYIRTYDPNAYRAPGSPKWQRWTRAEDRILFVTKATAMETVPHDQRARCRYLDSIEVTKL